MGQPCWSHTFLDETPPTGQIYHFSKIAVPRAHFLASCPGWVCRGPQGLFFFIIFLLWNMSILVSCQYIFNETHWRVELNPKQKLPDLIFHWAVSEKLLHCINQVMQETFYEIFNFCLIIFIEEMVLLGLPHMIKQYKTQKVRLQSLIYYSQYDIHIMSRCNTTQDFYKISLVKIFFLK